MPGRIPRQFRGEVAAFERMCVQRVEAKDSGAPAVSGNPHPREVTRLMFAGGPL